MFKNDNGNKINEKDKKNKIDTEDFNELYDLLKKKMKDVSENNICKMKYQNIWFNLGEILFQKEDFNKIDINENSKIKIDITKNKYFENESINLDAKDNMSLETIFKIIRYMEETIYIHNYDNDFENYKNEEEQEPPIIKVLIKEIKNLEILLTGDRKAVNSINKKKIELYLFLIYMILKNYPFYIPKRSFLEKYYLELKKYKDWPDQIGVQGKKLYKLFIDELYLPGITIFKEIRENYFLDSVDPTKFFLISDDFLRYYFFYDDKIDSSAYKFLKDDLSDDNFNINAKELLPPASNVVTIRGNKSPAEKKTLKECNYLTIMHLIIFFCQQVLSHKEKVSLNIFQRICMLYFKYIPDYKNIELLGKKQMEDKKENNNNAKHDKNDSRNSLNKSLLNSFLNIIDMGLKTDYYKDFLPMINELEKKILNSINGQDGTHDINYLNLREYLMPKIDIKNLNITSLIYLYQSNYINIEEKYLSHLNQTIDYKDYDINPEDKQRVDQFNSIVNVKKKILEKNLKMRFIIHEEQLISFIELLINNVEKLEILLINREKEEKLLKEQEKEQKEKEQKEKKLKQENEKKSKKKKDDSQIEKEKKRKEYIEKLKNMTYYELKNSFEKNQNNIDIQKIKEKRESDALPDIDNFLNSITLYILPNNEVDKYLSNYICRNNFIYQYIFFKKSGGDYNNINKLLKENLCIYLEEAKNNIELDVYTAILTSSENDENIIIRYFYSFIEIEIISGPFSIKILNNTEKPEYEKEIKYVKKEGEKDKIYIMNLMINEKGRKEILTGANYIVNENSGLLTVIYSKNTLNETNNNNMSYYLKLMALQNDSDIFNCDEIKITGNLKVKGLAGVEENSTFQELIVGHATYNLENQEKRVKLKIAVF